MRTLQPLPVQAKQKLQSTRQYSLDNLLPADYYPCFTVSNFTFLKDKKNNSAYSRSIIRNKSPFQSLTGK